MIPRPYQSRAIADTIAALGSKPVLVAPTGSGKTFMASRLVQRLAPRTLWLAHRRELVQQAADHLRALGLDVGIIQAGVRGNPFRAVQVASIQTLVQTLRRSPDLMPRADLVVVDEAHHARAVTYRDILNHYACPVVGLTATPFRLDGRGLGDIFGAIVVAAYPDDLCADGTLIAPAVYVPEDPDMRSVRITAGEYNLAAAARLMDRPKLIGNIITTWQRHAVGRRTLVFAINVAHSTHIVERFRAAGVTAEHLDGSIAAVERLRILARLRSGETTVVSNCMVLTEGFDLPALEVAIIARPTASLCLHLQMLGRIMRAAPDKTGAMVLDHAGNHRRHGEVTQRIDYSLEDEPKPVGDAPPPGEPRVRTCPDCFLVVPAAAETCHGCGHPFAADSGKFKEQEGELVPLHAPRAGASFDERARMYAQLEIQRTAFNYKPGYTAVRYKQIFGDYPTAVNGRLINLDNAPESDRASILRDLMAVAARKGFKPGWAMHIYKQRFGHWPTRAVRQIAEAS